MRRLWPALFAALLLSSCGQAGDILLALRAKSLYDRGRYQEATVAYLSLQGRAEQALVDYNLANTWSRLGEPQAAESLYRGAVEEGDAKLALAAWYNLGILRFEEGQYEEAWRAFREALSLDPGDEDAGRNLELAWRSWQKTGGSRPASLVPAELGGGGRAEEELRLLRRLEAGSWRPGRGSASPDQEGDW